MYHHQSPQPYPPPSSPPPRVQAAQTFICWATSKDQPNIIMPGSDGWNQADAKPLSKAEQAAYDAALHTLTMYFLGEMDYGDCPPTATSPHPPQDDDPKQPVAVG